MYHAMDDYLTRSGIDNGLSVPISKIGSIIKHDKFIYIISPKHVYGTSMYDISMVYH